MIDIWVKLVSDQFEIALNLTRAVFGMGESSTPAPAGVEPVEALVPNRADAPAANPKSEAATIPDNILSFLESANRGATVRQIAEHLEMDKRSVLPLLKTLVKERRIDELLGRYCVLNS